LHKGFVSSPGLVGRLLVIVIVIVIVIVDAGFAERLRGRGPASPD
jgi:hypothetical protein